MGIEDLEDRVGKLEMVLPAFSDDFRFALDYIEQDAGSSLTKSRSVLDDILVRIYTKKMRQSPGKPTLYEKLADLKSTSKIEPRILSRMHSIRLMGSLGPHGERVEPGYAAKALDDLCEVHDWYLRCHTSDASELARCSAKPQDQRETIDPVLTELSRRVLSAESAWAATSVQ